MPTIFAEDLPAKDTTVQKVMVISGSPLDNSGSKRNDLANGIISGSGRYHYNTVETPCAPVRSFTSFDKLLYG